MHFVTGLGVVLVQISDAGFLLAALPREVFAAEEVPLSPLGSAAVAAVPSICVGL